MIFDLAFEYPPYFSPLIVYGGFHVRGGGRIGCGPPGQGRRSTETVVHRGLRKRFFGHGVTLIIGIHLSIEAFMGASPGSEALQRIGPSEGTNPPS
jgi:hypothetical protein